LSLTDYLMFTALLGIIALIVVRRRTRDLA